MGLFLRISSLKERLSKQLLLRGKGSWIWARGEAERGCSVTAASGDPEGSSRAAWPCRVVPAERGYRAEYGGLWMQASPEETGRRQFLRRDWAVSCQEPTVLQLQGECVGPEGPAGGTSWVANENHSSS